MQKQPFSVFQKILVVIIVVCLGIAAYFGIPYIFSRFAYNDLSCKYMQDFDTTCELSKMSVDWDTLKADCPDAVGWIRVPDTIIDYPIVQGPDNDYYLYSGPDGESSWLTTGGSIFLDYQNSPDFSDKNNVLYGHNMNDGSMFAEFSSWVYQDQFDAHRTIYVLTPSMNYKLSTFSVIQTSADDAIIQTKFSTDVLFKDYVQDKIDRNVVAVSENDANASNVGKMFMFVTCEYSQDDGRACVCASVDEQAEPVNVAK